MELNPFINGENKHNFDIGVVDVCQSNLVKQIKSSHPCHEGFEVGNLISRNFKSENQGFLAEYFIKPPVILTLEFVSEIDIRYVIIMCKVGSQVSSGVELFTLTSASKNYESVGSGILPDLKCGFVFRKCYDYGNNVCGDQYYSRKFKTSRHLSSVKNFKLKIFRTKHSSVPAIGKIEIWGKPIHSSKEITEKNNINRPSNCTNVDSPISYESGQKSSQIRPTLNHNNVLNLTSGSLTQHLKNVNPVCIFQIPEDYIDPITNEIMTQPLILPSGKTIDSSTLEKYKEAETVWGRGPNDPFTGIPFSDRSRPKAASNLKVRIDKFLFDHSNKIELNNTPRTVGRNSNVSLSHSNERKFTVSKLINTANNDIETRNTPKLCEVSKIPLKRKRDDVETCLKDFKIGSTSFTRSKILITAESKHSVNSTLSMNCKVNTPTHVGLHSFEEKLEQSLEVSLKSTLSKLPKLSADKHSLIEETSIGLVCNICKTCDYLFSIPCNHFVCRKCLVSFEQKKNMVCSQCKSLYKSSDVKRIHVHSNS